MTNEISGIKLREHRQVEEIMPLTDIYETEDSYVIKAEMPGVSKENVDITLDGGVLTIKGNIGEESKGDLRRREFTPCNFGRSFSLGEDADSDRIEAAMNNGVLTLTVSKKAELKPKKIEITVH